jgi:hypothetical protein
MREALCSLLISPCGGESPPELLYIRGARAGLHHEAVKQSVTIINQNGGKRI